MAANGVYIVLGEANTIVALLNKARRQYQLSLQPPSHVDTDPLLRNFADLKEVLNEVADLADMNPLTYLSPFLDVIRAENTNGPITEAALSSVGKFLSYGLIDASSIKASHAVESVANAVVATKFIGGKTAGSDECVLYKILHVLRLLLLSPPGSLLSNEAVCDMMQSGFRIVFEQQLSPLLRKAAEATLSDMTQLIFTRLPTFHEDTRHPFLRKLVMNAKGGKKKRRRRQQRENNSAADSEAEEDEAELVVAPAKESDALLANSEGGEKKTVEGQQSSETADSNMDFDVVASTPEDATGERGTEEQRNSVQEQERADEADSESAGEGHVPKDSEDQPLSHDAGFIRDVTKETSSEEVQTTVQMPYGLPCCYELLRFIIALANPVDRNNTESMVITGLNLITVALEAAADHLSNYSFLMPLLKDNLCRSLLQVLDTEKLPVLAATNRACFLLFESMRSQLKFQLESYFHKLKSIVLSEQRTTSYEQKEMALESLVQLWRIPGLVTELYLNYDCDLYCSNVFEDMTKLLADMSFPVDGLRPASLLSLDALLVVIDTIDQNCVCRQAGAEVQGKAESKNAQLLEFPVLSGYEVGKRIMATADTATERETSSETLQSAPIVLHANRHAPSENMPSMSQVIGQKERKRIFAEGTEQFNQSPRKGIDFLRKKGLLGDDAESVVSWLRSNPQLDKKKIADYICSRKHTDVLEAFVKSFPFENTRLDDSLRMFLETFRLPGEAAEISMVMQHFSEEWYRANHEPFNHVDAAFTLSYAIIMLNMDQHNPQVRRAQPPMTIDCFKRNLSGTNGGQDFDPEMLTLMYNAIKSEEIVMPAEQTGMVKENYLWKVLLRRGETNEGAFVHAPTGWNDHALFGLVWGPAIAALSYVLDKTDHDIILKRALNGYRKCSSIAAHYGMKDVFDNLVIHLCKFSTLTVKTEAVGEDANDASRQRSLADSHGSSAEGIAISFGQNQKAQEVTRVLFELVHQNGDILKEGWRNMLDMLLYLCRARLLPADLTEVDDFVNEKGWVSIIRNHEKESQPARNESGLLSWFGLGGGVSEADRKKATEEEQNAVKLASQVISECRPSQLVTDSKYLTSSAISELLTALMEGSRLVVERADEKQKGHGQSTGLSGQDEDALVFYLELTISITLENKDRLALLWPNVKRHLEWLLSARFGRCPVLVERAVVGLLRIANRNLFRDNTVADDVLQSLSLLLRLSPKAMYMFSRQIAFGLHELLRNNAANVHRREHWGVLFALLEAAGAASLQENNEQQQPTPSTPDRNAVSDGEQHEGGGATTDDRGYTSDNTQNAPGRRTKAHMGYPSDGGLPSSAAGSGADSAHSLDRSQEWIQLDHKDAAAATQEALRALNDSRPSFGRGSLVLRTNMGRHEPAAFLKVAECLAFLLRDAVHVTPDNFESSISCLRTMVEAGLDGGRYAAGPLSGDAQNLLRGHADERGSKKAKGTGSKGGKKELSTDVVEEDESRDEEQQLSANYQQVSLQLLDLCSALHSKTPAILIRWAQDGATVDASVGAIWQTVWRPLLQAMARLACDCRRMVRANALTHLQRAFLPSIMANLGAAEWESCFGEVLFPLLTKLLEPFSAMDPIGMEDTRVRAMQIVCKTLLNHLSDLSSLPSFPGLWLRLLDFMEQYLRVDSCGNLNEAVPESLKNMLLVLDNTGLFSSVPGLHLMTTTRMGPVLPQLIRDTMPRPPVTTHAPQGNQGVEPTSLATVASNSPVGRVQIAPPIPTEKDSEQKPEQSGPSPSTSTHSTPSHAAAPQPTVPVEIPELMEVVVHSGATSPIATSPLATSPVVAEAPSGATGPIDGATGANGQSGAAPHLQTAETAAEQQVTTAASISNQTVQESVPSQSVPEYSAPQHNIQQYSQQNYQPQQYHPQQAQYQQHHATQQVPLHPTPDAPQPQYAAPPQPVQYAPPIQYPMPIHAANQLQQQQYTVAGQPAYMPQADLAKVFGSTQVPAFVPPSELLQSTYSSTQQYSAANPLSPPHMGPSTGVGQIAPSPNSAFTQVAEQSAHQSPHHFVPIQSHQQERP